jgi:hypothetical protein
MRDDQYLNDIYIEQKPLPALKGLNKHYVGADASVHREA